MLSVPASVNVVIAGLTFDTVKLPLAAVLPPTPLTTTEAPFVSVVGEGVVIWTSPPRVAPVTEPDPPFAPLHVPPLVYAPEPAGLLSVKPVPETFDTTNRPLAAVLP